MHSKGLAGSDRKDLFIFPETPPLMHKPSPPSVSNTSSSNGY
ncbi:hypothetical protein SLEP1_g56155 [Rubroshorea leprosula]|uniref:Uncharacterized protein n=1 Tax=Rubroshorea leprosula TaxID=152421 RepID=A0AAV5MK65_9ROSI|nr:hypothetical protein SLEP1_g56155 [Rubroshorea leprosula]